MKTKFPIIAILVGSLAGPAIAKTKTNPKKDAVATIPQDTLKKAVKKGKKLRASAKQREPIKREKFLIREKRVASGQKSIDFDEAMIQGEKVAPAVSTLAIPNANKEFDLIQLRTNWHQEMVLSADHKN